MNGDDDDNAETKFENINKLHSCSLLLLWDKLYFLFSKT